MAWFYLTGPRLRLRLPLLLLLSLLGGMGGQVATSYLMCSYGNANMFMLSSGVIPGIVHDAGECTVPEINAAFDAKMSYCRTSDGQLYADSKADCEATADNINKHPEYTGPNVTCQQAHTQNDKMKVLVYHGSYNCQKGVESILKIFARITRSLCNNVDCSNRGLQSQWGCRATKTLDDHVCTCNADLGGGWDGKDCELCNGGQPPIDPAKDCDGITLADCKKDKDLLRVCPTRCGMCYPCSGENDPPECATTTIPLSDCTKSNFFGQKAKQTCPVMCGICAAPSPSPPSPSPSPPSPSPPSPSPSPPSPSPPSPPTPPTPPPPASTTATTHASHDEPDDDPAELGITVLALIGEPIILAITSTAHYHHHTKKKLPRNRQGIFRLLKLWFAIMSCQLLLWVVLMKALYSDGEQVTNWNSKEASSEDTGHAYDTLHCAACSRTLVGCSLLTALSWCGCLPRIPADVRYIDDVFTFLSVLHLLG